MKAESFTKGKSKCHDMISLIAERPDDVYDLGQLSKLIGATEKGFTLECEISLQFSVDELVKALLKEPESCQHCG